MYIYIKEAKNNEDLIKKVDMPKVIKKIIINLKKIFNIITIRKIDELHYLYIIPQAKNIKKIEKIIRKNSESQIILSKELKKYKEQLNLKEDKIIQYFIYDILTYIMNKINIKLELQNIYICVNEYKEESIDIIKFLIDKVKTVNIVTNNIKKFNSLEERLYNQHGILIAISNNRNKALRRANFIINLDFNNEELKNYKINRNSIIINSTNEKIEILYFQGIIVNNIKIAMEEKEKYKELYKDFNKIDICNTFEFSNTKYIENINKIEQSKIKIEHLLGNNGIIDVKELLNIQKNIDKL